MNITTTVFVYSKGKLLDSKEYFTSHIAGLEVARNLSSKKEFVIDPPSFEYVPALKSEAYVHLDTSEYQVYSIESSKPKTSTYLPIDNSFHIVKGQRSSPLPANLPSLPLGWLKDGKTVITESQYSQFKNEFESNLLVLGKQKLICLFLARFKMAPYNYFSVNSICMGNVTLSKSQLLYEIKNNSPLGQEIMIDEYLKIASYYC
jgi:hypothetical protein